MISHEEASVSRNILELALDHRQTLTSGQFNTLAAMAADILAEDTDDDIASRVAVQCWRVSLSGENVYGSRINAVKKMREELGWSLRDCVAFLNGMPEFRPYVDRLEREQRERLDRDEYLGDD